jgi:hypothetical protein
MSNLVILNLTNLRGAALRRAVAFDNVNWFRAAAWRVLREGGPRAGQRAANARAAAREVLRQIKQEAVDARMAREALTADL